MNKLLRYYIKAVKYPDVSGFEHLEMLAIRDKVAEIEPNLSPAEKDKLAEADSRLSKDAYRFYSALSHVTDLQYERKRRQIPTSHWWWYLDVLSHTPVLLPSQSRLEMVLA